VCAIGSQDGKTASDLAKQNGHAAVAALFRSDAALDLDADADAESDMGLKI
jgi:hypothetical protein